MGNRAVIETKKRDLGLYLHWHGGRDSVEAFLAYCRIKGFVPPEVDGGYGWARLVQVIGNYLGGGDSLGIAPYFEQDEDNWDNGVYVIENWQIVDRLYLREDFKEQQTHDLLEMLDGINSAQPELERIHPAFLDETRDDHIAPEDLMPGDLVLWDGYSGARVSGMVGGETFVNEHRVRLVPIVELEDGLFEWSRTVAAQQIVRTIRP